MPRKKKSKAKSGSISGLKDKVLHLYKKNPKLALNHKQVCSRLKVTNAIGKGQVMGILTELTSLGVLTHDNRGKFRIDMPATYVTGKLDGTARGSAYLVSPDFPEDIFIHSKNMGHAFPGDKVKVNITSTGKKVEGAVVEVLERAKTHFVGVLDVSSKYAFLITDDPKIKVDFFVPLVKLNGGKKGDKVVVKMLDWPKEAKSPYAEVVEILGKPGENDAEIHAILWEFDLPYEFPPHVEDYAAAIPMELDEKEVAKRRDMRDVLTFTIDPFDAKDFDDALSIQKLDNGNWEIGVHIADVTHYVRPGDIIDKEAVKRATSVYLVDRVVPMLPEKLSNGVCSLRPNEDKYTFSAVFQMDDNADIVSSWFGRTAIHSDRRFTYEEAQEMIEGGDGDYKDEVLTFDRLAKKLRERRYKKGAINFGKREVKFQLDEDAKPIGVYFKEGKDSNHLIEEFMLLANKKVTEFVSKGRDKKDRTFVFRVHDNPDPEKFSVFSQFVRKLGFGVKAAETGKAISSSLNTLMRDIKGSKEQEVIETLAIRTMAKAIYDVENIGHYGLAFDHYTHFTSPIRRYPDVMVHRLLQNYLDKKKSPAKEHYAELCEHSSMREKLAAEAERASIKYKQVEFMADRVGEEFDAVISGVSAYGFYAEVEETRCEGMVRLADMDWDHFVHDQDNYCVVGTRSGEKFTFGDRVRVKLKHADLLKKQLDFEFVERLEDE